MAAEYLTSISNALATTFSARLRRQWNRTAVIAAMLPYEPAVGQGGGKQVGWDVEFSGAQAYGFSEGADVTSTEFAVDPVVPAVLPFGQYRSAFQLSNLEIKTAQANPANAAELGRIMMERLDGSLAKLAMQANSDLITGTGVGLDVNNNTCPAIIGLSQALSQTGVYAGINKSTYAEWQGNVLANGGTARSLTQDLIYNADQLIYVNSGKTAKVIVASPGVYRTYAGLFETIKKVFQTSSGELPNYTGGENEMSWKGMPVIRDRNMPAR
jgi:hypothetical protein